MALIGGGRVGGGGVGWWGWVASRRREKPVIKVYIVPEAINPRDFVKILMVNIFAMLYCTALKF